jgi:hypothetical protein
MSADFSPRYVARVRPCTIHAGRFRWDIRNVNDGDQPVQPSDESYATVEKARAAAQGAYRVNRRCLACPGVLGTF